MENEITAIFDQMVNELMALLPDFGKHLAIDGKVATHARPNKEKKQMTGAETLMRILVRKSTGKREDVPYGKRWSVGLATGCIWWSIPNMSCLWLLM